MARVYYQRWYEKNEYMRAFMNLFHDLPIDEQCEIAIDIIMDTSSLIDRDYANLIKDVSDYNPKDYRRWYDKNPNVHLAIESMRDLTDEQKEEVIQKYIDRILLKRNNKETENANFED